MRNAPDREATAPERNLAIAERCGREAERPLREGKHGWGVLRHTLTGTEHTPASHIRRGAARLSLATLKLAARGGFGPETVGGFDGCLEKKRRALGIPFGHEGGAKRIEHHSAPVQTEIPQHL